MLSTSNLADLDTELTRASVLLLGLGVEEGEPMLDGVADVDILVFSERQSHFSNKVSADGAAVVAVDGDDGTGQSVCDIAVWWIGKRVSFSHQTKRTNEQQKKRKKKKRKKKKWRKKD